MAVEPIGMGVGSLDRSVCGRVIEWRDEFLTAPRAFEGKVVYSRGGSPLYRTAFLIDHGARAVILGHGGKNYHPLILLKDGGVPSVAGVGDLDIDGRDVVVDAGKGLVLPAGSIEVVQSTGAEAARLRTVSKVYVNVGYPTALVSAAESGADGIGLLRTEFTAARTLSRVLDRKMADGAPVKAVVVARNEADAIYAISRDENLRKEMKRDLKDTFRSAMNLFRGKEVSIRTLDIARHAGDPMGYRGIRRCVAEGGHTIRMIAESIRECILEEGRICDIAVILPLVSHYSQVTFALNVLLDTGLALRGGGRKDRPEILFGWEIEQPAASENHEVWMEAFRANYGRPVDLIGIGTNDLTQFTMALGRDAYAEAEDSDVAVYLHRLYDESDYCVVRQIYNVSKYCRDSGMTTRLFLLGQAAAQGMFAELMLAFGVIPSVDISSVLDVRRIAHRFETRGSPRREVISEYVDNLCDKLYASAKDHVRPVILKSLGLA